MIDVLSRVRRAGPHLSEDLLGAVALVVIIIGAATLIGPA